MDKGKQVDWAELTDDELLEIRKRIAEIEEHTEESFDNPYNETIEDC